MSKTTYEGPAPQQSSRHHADLAQKYERLARNRCIVASLLFENYDLLNYSDEDVVKNENMILQGEEIIRQAQQDQHYAERHKRLSRAKS